MAQTELKEVLNYIQSKTRDVGEEELYFNIQLGAEEVVRGLALLRKLVEYNNIEQNQSILMDVPSEITEAGKGSARYKFGRIVGMYAYERNPVYEIPKEFYRHIDLQDSTDIDGAAVARLDNRFYRAFQSYISNRPYDGSIVSEHPTPAGPGEVYRVRNFVNWRGSIADNKKLVVEYCYTITKDSEILPRRLFDDYAELIGLAALRKLADAHLLDRKDMVESEYEKRYFRAMSRVSGGGVLSMDAPVGGVVGDTRSYGGYVY